jgi:hypothetical protein
MKSRFLFFFNIDVGKKGLAFIEARENVSFIEHMHSKTVKTPQPALERSERVKPTSEVHVHLNLFMK